LTFLAPLALAALLVGPAIYLVHVLHGSRKKVRVAALFLWANLPRASSGRRRRRWPPLSLLLALQILAGILAALALARPAISSDPPRHLVVVLDASASMQATDVAPTRFEAARKAAGQRLSSLSPNDRATLIRAGSEATLVTSGSPEAVRAGLASVQVGLGGAATREALALASSQVATTPQRRGQIVLLTDAAWTPLQPLGALDAPVEVVPLGGGAENQAVSSLQIRMDPSGRAQTAFVEISNIADHAVRVPVRVTADDAPLDQRDVDLAARGLTWLSVPLPLEAHTVAVRLAGRDALSLDDAIVGVAPGGPPRDVLLIGRPTASLRRAFESIPFVRLLVADLASGDRPHADVTVLDGVLPAQLPPGPLLLVDPPAFSARLLGVGVGSAARVQAAHPLLQGLDLVGLRNESPSVTGVPGWANVVLGTVQGPLVLAGRLEGHPTVALTFDPTLSGLEKSLAYPLLISNATRFLLAPAEAPGETFDGNESDIRPLAVQSFAASAQRPVADGWLERWPWLLGGVLALLTVEWVVFARRG
jgi:Ca-activated chloride channel homolog